MTVMWITTPGLILCILITWTCALPLQKNPGDQESDEGDSDEEESNTSQSNVVTPQLGVQNVSNQELTDKATLFLTRYFANQGQHESPFHIPTNLNHTIVIHVVPNNDTHGGTQNLVFTPLEGSPSFVGDIAPLFPSQQYPYQFQQFQQGQAPLQQQQQQQQKPQEGTPVNLTPVQNLVGFVPKNKPPPVRGVSELQKDISLPSTTVATTTTTTVVSVKEQPVDNIEDAILEALSIAEGGTGQGGSGSSGVLGGGGGEKQAVSTGNGGTGGVETQKGGTASGGTKQASQAGQPGNGGGGHVGSSPSFPANENFQALIDSGVIPGLTNNKGGGIHVPSNFGPVFIQTDERPTVPSSGTVFLNQNTPTPAPAAAPPAVVAPPNIIFLQPFHPPTDNENDNDEERSTTVGRLQGPINAVSGIIGSISEGNLGGAVQNTIKLAETPVFQESAKLATVAVLHNLFQAVNPCNFLGNCRPRPPLRIKK